MNNTNEIANQLALVANQLALAVQIINNIVRNASNQQTSENSNGNGIGIVDQTGNENVDQSEEDNSLIVPDRESEEDNSLNVPDRKRTKGAQGRMYTEITEKDIAEFVGKIMFIINNIAN